jgi:hypothetical protein
MAISNGAISGKSSPSSISITSICFILLRRSKFFSQSGESFVPILNRKTLRFTYPSLNRIRASANASPPLLPVPAKITNALSFL